MFETGPLDLWQAIMRVADRRSGKYLFIAGFGWLTKRWGQTLRGAARLRFLSFAALHSSHLDNAGDGLLRAFERA